MPVNRNVGYATNLGPFRGTNLTLVNVGTGFTVTRFTCTWRMLFQQVTNINPYSPLAVWGVALQHAAAGSHPTAWNASGTDASILAFDNAEPVGLERIFWTPPTNGVDIVAAFSGSLTWRGQLLLAASTDFQIVPVDVTNAAATWNLGVAWQIWYG